MLMTSYWHQLLLLLWMVVLVVVIVMMMMRAKFSQVVLPKYGR